MRKTTFIGNIQIIFKRNFPFSIKAFVLKWIRNLSSELIPGFIRIKEILQIDVQGCFGKSFFFVFFKSTLKKHVLMKFVYRQDNRMVYETN